MAKTKTPLLSLSAKGTLSDHLTLQKKGSLTMVRTKPIPSDPQTLLQMYQRWEVKDYIAYWQTLSDAQKLVYFRAGARNHRTPVAEFLKEMLTDLPDIVLRYRMDTISAGLTPDSSKNSDHASVLAPSLVDGVIAQGMYFDDVDDWLRAPKTAGRVDGDISLEVFCNPQPAASRATTLITTMADGSPFKTGYRWFLWWNAARTNHTCYFYFGDGVANHARSLGVWNYVPGITYHLIMTHDGTNTRLYKDGLLFSTRAAPWTLVSGEDYFFSIGRQPFNNTQRFKGMIDHAVVYNRVLTLNEIYLRSQRHYPL